MGLALAITVDVEEEGLFCGKYPRVPPGVRNVQELSRLEFIPQEFGFPITFMVTYAVARDKGACRILRSWCERYKAEIGAHLHHWNTPPFINLPGQRPGDAASASTLPWQEKLISLLRAIREGLGVFPRSFRMGRFEVNSTIISLLRQHGLVVDSSKVPLRQVVGGPDQFLTPPDPHWLHPPNSPEGPLLEVPLTVVAWSTRISALTYRLSRLMPDRQGELWRRGFSYVGTAGPQPTMYPLFSMCHGVRLHRRRGGEVITMYLHSSELLPGGSPQFPDELAVQGLVRKIRKFLTWLVQTNAVTGVTLAELYAKRAGDQQGAVCSGDSLRQNSKFGLEI